MWKRLIFARSTQGLLYRDGGRISNLSGRSLVGSRKIQGSFSNCWQGESQRDFSSNVEDRPAPVISNDPARFGIRGRQDFLDDDVFAIVTGVDPTKLSAKERAPTAMLRPSPIRESESQRNSGREAVSDRNQPQQKAAEEKEKEKPQRKEKQNKPSKEAPSKPSVAASKSKGKAPKNAVAETSESDDESTDSEEEKETPKSLKKKQKELLRKSTFIKPLKNEQITAPNVRVNYITEQSEKKSEIMNTNDAIQFAKSQNCDLILVVPNVDPPVCKIQNYYTFIAERRKQDHQIRKLQKLAIPKEIQMKLGIDLHDFQHKMRRTKMFLSEGRTVNVTVFCRVKRARRGRKKIVNTSLTTMTTLDIITDHLKAYFADYPLAMNINDQFVTKFVPDAFKPGQARVKPNAKTGAGGSFVKVHDRREFLMNFKGSREQMLKKLKEAQAEEAQREKAKAKGANVKSRHAKNEAQKKKERQLKLLAEAGLGDFEDDEEEDEFDEEDEAFEGKHDDDEDDYDDLEEDDEDDLVDQDDLEDDDFDEGEWDDNEDEDEIADEKR